MKNLTDTQRNIINQYRNKGYSQYCKYCDIITKKMYTEDKCVICKRR